MGIPLAKRGDPAFILSGWSGPIFEIILCLSYHWILSNKPNLISIQYADAFQHSQEAFLISSSLAASTRSLKYCSIGWRCLAKFVAKVNFESIRDKIWKSYFRIFPSFFFFLLESGLTRPSTTHILPVFSFSEGDGESDGSFHIWAICSVVYEDRTIWCHTKLSSLTSLLSKFEQCSHTICTQTSSSSTAYPTEMHY